MALYWLLSGEEMTVRARRWPRSSGRFADRLFQCLDFDARRACRLAAIRLGRYAESAKRDSCCRFCRDIRQARSG